MKTSGKFTAAAAALALSMSVAAGDDEELAAFKKATRALYDMKEQAFADNDPQPILNRFYTRDVLSTGPGGNTHFGTEGIRPVYEQVIGDSVRVESFYPYVNGDAGWDWTNFHVTPADPGVEPFTFKMLFLWTRIDGEWRCKGEMYVIGQFEADPSGH